ncbi:DUF6174 domain-containing protein [Nocardioides bigeumensis]|uniref:DUF6174 domain-containing protein n=1 Tax=Nocardioides bigeumensis TaxID=433657 RepID=UPI0031D3C0B7
MKRLLVSLAATVVLVLSGCGGASDDDTATDPDASGESGAPQESPSPEPEMIGDYPAYPHADYSYELEVQCFCPVGGQPILVTVSDDRVTDAVFTTKAPGIEKGSQAKEDWLRLTIDDVLREAADPSYDKVEVEWPDGADHPDRVAIDRITNAMDDEVTYVISNVQPA